MRQRVNCLAIALIACSMSLHPSCFITYSLSDGRFGDHLLAYCHAKWLSHSYNIPLLYKPFQYSDELMLHYLEEEYDDMDPNLSECLYIDGSATIDPKSNMIYSVPFFPESPLEMCLEPFNAYYFAVDWNDSAFKQELQKMIYPVNRAIPLLDLPHDHITVALHVRKGTHFDSILGNDVKDLCDRNKGPLLFKIPPDSYYLDQLKKIAAMYNPQSLYVYIFTDHDNPKDIAEYYQSCLEDYSINFDFRREENRHNLHVVEDFFCMIFTPFDCLIRPESHYSFVASKLGNYRLIISPKNYFFEGDTAIINEVTIEISG